LSHGNSPLPEPAAAPALCADPRAMTRGLPCLSEAQHRIRDHAVFAGNATWRAEVVPGPRLESGEQLPWLDEEQAGRRSRRDRAVTRGGCWRECSAWTSASAPRAVGGCTSCRSPASRRRSRRCCMRTSRAARRRNSSVRSSSTSRASPGPRRVGPPDGHTSHSQSSRTGTRAGTTAGVAV